MKTLKELIEVGATLKDNFEENNVSIWEYNELLYIVKGEKIIHKYKGLPKYKIKK